MLTVSEVEQIILNLAQPFNPESDIEDLPLSQALNRIAAKDIVSELDFPHWHNSAMDGYALRHADLEGLSELRLAIAPDEIAAGSVIKTPLAEGKCMRIFTGGMLPIGADTIIMQEDTERIGDELIIKVKPDKGDYVRHQGEFIKANATLIRSGTKLGATEIGALASARCRSVKVYRQPKIMIISTGNELVSLDSSSPLAVGKIIDSNSYALASLVKQLGITPISLGPVPDDPKELSNVLTKAIASADIVISSGGVSVGDYDYVDQVLQDMGAEIHCQSVAIKPGKPLTVATIGKTLFFGVAGNPVSAMVTFWRFIRGAIAKLGGANSEHWYPQFIKAIAISDLHAQGRRETYLWGKLTYQKGSPVFQPVQNYSSGNLISAIGTNALAVMRINQTYVPANDETLVMLIE